MSYHRSYTDRHLLHLKDSNANLSIIIKRHIHEWINITRMNIRMFLKKDESYYRTMITIWLALPLILWFHENFCRTQYTEIVYNAPDVFSYAFPMLLYLAILFRKLNMFAALERVAEECVYAKYFCALACFISIN